MTPVLRRGMVVKNQSRLYEHRYAGAESVPAWSIGRITDFKAYYWDLVPLVMLARVRFDVDFTNPDGQRETRSVDVWVNERALVQVLSF